MHNISKEIILLINLLLWNDKRSPIEEDDFFEKDGIKMKKLSKSLKKEFLEKLVDIYRMLEVKIQKHFLLNYGQKKIHIYLILYLKHMMILNQKRSFIGPKNT